MEKALTVEQVAQALQLSVDTVRLLLRQGTLPGIKIRRAWRIPESALKEWMRPQRIPPAAAPRVSARGKGKHIPVSSDAYMREKRQEVEREQQRGQVVRQAAQ